MKNSIRLTILSLAAALAFSTSAFAATATGNLAVTAFMNQSCSAISGTLVFGNYDVLQNVTTALKGKGSVTITCTAGAPVIVTLDRGANYGLSKFTSLRAMSATTDPVTYLGYSLYSDSSYSVPWGDTGTTSGYANTIAGDGFPTAGNGATAVVLPVYGSIASGQTGAVGVAAFTDTVAITTIF